MQRLDSGRGTLKAIFTLGFLGALVYCSVKIIPIYVNNYQLQDYIEQQTPFWLTQRNTAEAIRNNILAKAQELDLPVSSDQVKVEATGSRVTVHIDYTVPVDLQVYTLNLHFTPSSENRSI